MRDKFKGYYQPTKDEENLLWGKALIIMDTNVVLDLYRYHAKTTRLYLDALEKFQIQLWLPYQIALEFHENRPVVRAESTKAHDERIGELNKFKNKMNSRAHKSKLRPLPIEVELLEKVDSAISALDVELEAIRREADPKTPDLILNKITALFEGRVGEQPTVSALEKMTADGSNRFDAQVPPGYEDRGRKPEGKEYGDYFLWRQLMDHAKESSQDVIFATEDFKSDWWLKIGGSTIIGPRPELIQEFREETGQDIIFYSGRDFFERLTRRGTDSANKSDLEDALADVTAVSNERMDSGTTTINFKAPIPHSLKSSAWFNRAPREASQQKQRPSRDEEAWYELKLNHDRLEQKSILLQLMEEFDELMSNVVLTPANLDRAEELQSSIAGARERLAVIDELRHGLAREEYDYGSKAHFLRRSQDFLRRAQDMDADEDTEFKTRWDKDD